MEPQNSQVFCGTSGLEWGLQLLQGHGFRLLGWHGALLRRLEVLLRCLGVLLRRLEVLLRCLGVLLRRLEVLLRCLGVLLRRVEVLL